MEACGEPVDGVRPGVNCSPRHRMSYKSQKRGLGTDGQCSPHHQTHFAPLFLVLSDIL